MIDFLSVTRASFAFLLIPIALPAQLTAFTFDDARKFLESHCQVCHQGANPAGGFAIRDLGTADTLSTQSERWNKLLLRVRHGEMPPKAAPSPAIAERERFLAWGDTAIRTAVCSAGSMPGCTPARRLNREEYAATIRDLLDLQTDLTSFLPADGAGGEGFDNAGETLFLTPLLAEKYLDAAKFALDAAFKELKPRARILVARPGNGTTREQAAHTILSAFLPRAFRRPVAEPDLAQYMNLFRAATRQGQEFESAIAFTLRAVLVSPRFLFLSEPANRSSDVRRADGYTLASRMSYFLWGSMPDELLFDIAGSGKLQEPETVHALLPRMLRREQSLDFVKRFVDQWLRTRQLETDKVPDAKLFPAWTTDAEIASDIRLQPALFFHEILKRDLSLLNLIDSSQTVLTRKLTRHFGEPFEMKGADQQPRWLDLPQGSTRGGLLGMPAVLIVGSYPYRTSPVLRGAWILEAMLGTPPPPPPAAVPPLDKQASAEAPKTVREMLTLHRANAVCATCHSRIDPLGFALENYDFIGRWRDQDNGKPVDNRGEMPDGAMVEGPQGLKAALLARKDEFVRNLTSRMLGYALGRGLTAQDSCAVDRIVADLRDNDYRAQKLIEGIILSAPFQYQPVCAARAQGGKK
jgi:mono/diheme cytochrome c family protein